VYRPVEPRVIAGPELNASIDQVQASLIGTDVEVKLRTSALPGTRLRGVKLASIWAEPCSEGVAQTNVERDGAYESEGPLALDGPHTLTLTFVKPWSGHNDLQSPLRASTALDLELDSASGQRCQRLPFSADAPERVSADAPERSFRPDPQRVGFLLGFGARAFPIDTTSAPGIEPAGTGFMRIGGATDASRLWLELAGGGADRHGIFQLAPGGDTQLVGGERWGLTGGFAYDFVFSVARKEAGLPTGHNYFLHGPRLTPALWLDPFSHSSPYPGFQPAHRVTYFELEVPVSGWFGARGAPDFVIVPGIGLGFHVTL
jgi:hypothetical protein